MLIAVRKIFDAGLDPCSTAAMIEEGPARTRLPDSVRTRRGDPALRESVFDLGHDADTPRPAQARGLNPTSGDGRRSLGVGAEFVGRMYIRELFASLARRSGWRAAGDGSG